MLKNYKFKHDKGVKYEKDFSIIDSRSVHGICR